MKTLIIAEKPDMGRNIAAAIEPKAKNMRTHLEGEHYIITWAIGHLVSLAEPDLYDEKYKKWNLSHLPIIPEQFKLIPNKQTLTQLNIIKDLAKQADMLVNACDAGREGQYIFHLIQTYLNLKQPVKRLWISDLTTETIKKGFAELREGEDYRPLTLAATARSEADWLIGMNGTRAFTTKHNELLSVGRVQTPVLALIYDREKLIEQFDSLVYYEVEAHFVQQNTTYKGVLQAERMSDKEKAEQIAKEVDGKTGRIESYEKKDVKEYPHKLYDLTLLQREANAKLNFSAKKTLDVAQGLYEKHKVITYPRTNSNYVNEQNIPEMHKALQSLKGSSYGQWAEKANSSYVHKNNKAICNPAKVEDHHAILPTAKRAGNLNADEQKLYDLIVKRFLSQFYDPAQYIAHTVITEVEKHTFKTNIKELVSLGWKQLIQEQENETKKSRSKKEQEDVEEEVEIDLPFELDAKLPVHCKQAEMKEKQTKPPKSFTEGTLLKAMESAGKQIENDDMREAMKDSGLGTPATRASTIERLKNVGYITMQGKRITITAKGKLAIELIRGAGVDLLTSPEMTGMWEKRLNDIARGQASNEVFMENVKKFAQMIVQKVSTQRAVNKQLFQAKEEAPKTKQAATKAKASATKTRATTKNKTTSKPASKKSTSSPEAPRTKAEAVKQTTSTMVVISPCPNSNCNGHIILGKKDYGCTGYKNGCRVIIRQQMFGYQLQPADIIQLIKTGKTKPVSLYTPGGEQVQAPIVLVDKLTGECSIEL